MTTRGIRGAITVKNNKKEEILSATKELLAEIVAANEIRVDDIAAIIFTATDDLDAGFPAEAARDLGWNDTPLLCSREINVPQSLPKCLRVLLLVNSNRSPKEIKHIYLGDAVNLRR